jgi:tetratricopeptide (TPR) repeat protein
VDALFNLGILYQDANRTAEAVSCYEAVMQLAPDFEGAKEAIEAARSAARA